MSLSNKQLIVLGLVICLFEGAFWSEYYQNATKLRQKQKKHKKESPKVKENNSLQKNPTLAVKREKKNVVAYTPAKTPKTKKQNTHKIKHGDKLWVLSKNYFHAKTNREILKGVVAIKTANKWLVNENKLPIGRRLIIPGKKEINSIQKIRKQVVPKRGKLLPTVHQLVLGETLYQLAYYYYRDEKKWLDILSANPHLDPTKLQAGIKLTIPLCQGQDR